MNEKIKKLGYSYEVGYRLINFIANIRDAHRYTYDITINNDDDRTDVYLLSFSQLNLSLHRKEYDVYIKIDNDIHDLTKVKSITIGDSKFENKSFYD